MIKRLVLTSNSDVFVCIGFRKGSDEAIFFFNKINIPVLVCPTAMHHMFSLDNICRSFYISRQHCSYTVQCRLSGTMNIYIYIYTYRKIVTTYTQG